MLSDAYRYQSVKNGSMLFDVKASANGPIVNEIRLSANEYLHISIKLYKDLNFLETEWLVGPINVTDNISKEIIVQYNTDLFNNAEFFTDSNGRQMLKRILFQRPTWNFTIIDPIASNYYPVTNRIHINDRRYRFTVLTDRAQGGSSLRNGQIELMLHRRLLKLANTDLLEPINEISQGRGLVVRGKHRLLFSDGNNKKNSIREKKQVIEFHLQPIILISESSQIPLEKWLKLTHKDVSFTNTLPEGIHLLTVEPFGDNKILLRLENYLDVGDKKHDAIDVNLATIFKTITVTSYKETKLAGNMWKTDYKKHHWRHEAAFSTNFNDDYGRYGDLKAAKEGGRGKDVIDEDFVINLRAKEIRSFIVEYEHL
ncbi:lysosomal alpha-mannosidase-like [Hyposmocoma kahamanoa]|uniref:lysosomal alpha-mannosidase-like n=1 Tax=Hyposmocoma kahamanoa TaxID=1477025 RepID=UPI000E6D7218|nr:lysosomal alpha-mannosidase-like [Hyposmocoma kahamanoa]